MTTTPTSPASIASNSARRHSIVLLLAVVGGSIDAAVILGFGVLTAAQTGNTILLAVSLVQHHFVESLHSVISVAGYVAGAAFSELLMVRCDVNAQKKITIVIRLSAELAVVALLAILWYIAERHPAIAPAPVLVALAAIAMGMQSATVLRLHSGPKTTYVTGTITNFTTKAVRWLRVLETAPSSTSSRASEIESQGDPPSYGDPPSMYGLNWLIYFLGAAVGGIIFLNFHETALLLPIAALAGAITVALS